MITKIEALEGFDTLREKIIVAIINDNCAPPPFNIACDSPLLENEEITQFENCILHVIVTFWPNTKITATVLIDIFSDTLADEDKLSIDAQDIYKELIAIVNGAKPAISTKPISTTKRDIPLW